MDKLKLLNLFAGTNEGLRPQFNKPFSQNGVIMATDCYTAICMPDVGDIELEPYAKPVTTIFNPTAPCHFIVDIENIERQIIEKTPQIDEVLVTTTECCSCDGEGGEECSLDHWHACDECEGKGKHEHKKATGKKVPDTTFYYRLNGTVFAYRVITRLIEACKQIGCKEISCISCEKYKGNIFKHNDIQIVLMPCTTEEAIQLN
jgi:hypothetical protein